MDTIAQAASGAADLDGLMLELGRAARASARKLALSPRSQRDQALLAAAAALRARYADIVAVNAIDVAEARARGTAGSFIDRLTLDAARVEAITADMEQGGLRLHPDSARAILSGAGERHRGQRWLFWAPWILAAILGAALILN